MDDAKSSRAVSRNRKERRYIGCIVIDIVPMGDHQEFIGEWVKVGGLVMVTKYRR